ncbi:MAG: hypothetical protein IJV31_01445 [Clostridia bacterium]|nr:hypothetical protein [Clostridia bacterium]
MRSFKSREPSLVTTTETSALTPRTAIEKLVVAYLPPVATEGASYKSVISQLNHSLVVGS